MTQDIIQSTTLPYFSAKLAYTLRHSCRKHQEKLDNRMREVVKSLQNNLIEIVSASDEDIVKGLVVSKASPQTTESMKEGGSRWALLVGIDTCPKLNHALLGPRHDIARFSRLLQERFDFPSEHIIPLVNRDAKRADIFNALDSISDETQAKDLILFYFSGNGSQVIPDKTNPDRRVATLVPYDSGREDGQNFDIGEPELNRYWRKISKDRRLVVIIDACHSGGMGENQNALPPLHPEDSVRGLGPLIPANPPDGDSFGAELSLADNYTILSACRKSETAHEANLNEGLHYGVFSYHLSSVLEKADPSTSICDRLSRAFQPRAF